MKTAFAILAFYLAAPLAIAGMQYVDQAQPAPPAIAANVPQESLSLKKASTARNTAEVKQVHGTLVSTATHSPSRIR